MRTLLRGHSAALNSQGGIIITRLATLLILAGVLTLTACGGDETCLVTDTGNELCEDKAHAYCQSIVGRESNTEYTTGKCGTLRRARMSKREKAEDARLDREIEKMVDDMSIEEVRELNESLKSE